jgi:hypothetical protein
LVHFTEIDFLRMLFDEAEDILLSKAVNIVAVAVVATGALQAVAEPAI